jgi:hypothetical protein
VSVPVTVVCLFVVGEYPYTPEYVVRLREMVARWIDRPFDFVCLTDCGKYDSCDDGGTVIRYRQVVKSPGCFAYWTKLQLFNQAHGFTGRMLYLDLDTLIVAPLAPILDAPAPFAITSDLTGKTGRDKYGGQIVRRFNSSVMVWDAGTQNHLFERWTPADAQRLSGDQDWIGEQAPDAYALPRAWFPRLSEVKAGPPFDPEVKVVLSKFPKNHVAAAQLGWFAPMWGGA